jgi:peptidoglycan/LPS O-acetylase OafA/YrhL
MSSILPGSTKNFHPSYRPDIDGLRALAILAVVIYHAFPDKLKGGFIGVDVFFVLSGYLISSIIYKSLERGAFSFTDFYARRIRRIFPALIVVLASCYLFGCFALLSDEFRQLAKHTAYSAGFAQNFALWGEAGYFDNASNLKPLMHLWSLAIEEQFYLLFPVLMWGAWRLGLNLFTVALLGLLLSFGLNVAQVHTHPAATFFLPLTRFWELLAGALLAHAQLYRTGQPGAGLAGWLKACLRQRLQPRPASAAAALPVCLCNALSVLGVLLLLAGFARLNATLAFPGWWALLPVAGTLCALAAGPHAWLNRHVLGCRPLVFIGAISYPLYLWHWPLLAFSRIIDELPTGERNLAVLLSFVLAWLTYRFVERPVRFGMARRHTTLVLCLLLAGLAWLGVAPTSLGRAGVLQADHRSGINTFEYAYKQSCQGVIGTSGDADWCNAGNAGGAAPDVLLVGDSFSNAYADMFAAYASQEPAAQLRFSQVGRGNCPLLLGYGSAECRAFTATVQNYVARHPAIHTVVLAGHWPAYFDRQEGGVTATAAEFERAFHATVEHYQGLHKRVVVLLAPPTGSKPRSCLARPITMTKKRLCDLPQPLATENDGAYRASMLPYLAARQVPVFDPFRALCDGAICKTIDGDQILYVDINHLSPFGGAYLARHQVAALRELLRQP